MIRMRTIAHREPITEVETAIERGLAYLEQKQLPTGAFPVLIWSDPPGSVPEKFDSCVFPTASIAHCLSFAHTARAKAMLASAATFLLREMEPGAVWRYWTSDDPRHFDIPPDLDDMVCISAVLRRQGVRFPDNRNLILANRDSDGLFYTWLTPRFRWNRSVRYWKTVLPQLRHPRRLWSLWKTEAKPDDVDCVVNANVLFYLGGGPGMRPVADYIVDTIHRKNERECDKWYFNPLVIYYFISRCFASGVVELGPLRNLIIDRIAAATGEHGDIGASSLETAMGICALLDWNADCSLNGSVTSLLRRQMANGSWEKAAVYGADINRWGSDEWSTGFCLEALVRYLECTKRR